MPCRVRKEGGKSFGGVGGPPYQLPQI